MTSHDLIKNEHTNGEFKWTRYAKLYGLNEQELRYILDPVDVYGEDYPSESFRVLKEKEIAEFGEYRTRRLVLEAWERMTCLAV